MSMSHRSLTSHDIVMSNDSVTREFNTKRTASMFVMVVFKISVTIVYQAFLNGDEGKVEICVNFNICSIDQDSIIRPSVR